MALKKNPDVAWRTVEGQAILVHNREGEIQVLNEVGTYVWEHFEDGIEKMIRDIAEKYETDPQVIREDVESFVNELIGSQVLLETQEA